MNAILTRTETGPQGTFGALFIDGHGFLCYTGELPWHENKTGISCIPVGEYPCFWRKSPHFGMCYHVEMVPNRMDVLIHRGNWCGDKAADLHLKSDVKGCILVGMEIGTLAGQKALTKSGEAFARLEEITKHERLILTVHDSPTMERFT